MIATIVAWLSFPAPKDFPRESQTFLEVSTEHQGRTISRILKKPKDKIEKDSSRGIVYKVKCKNCGCVYVGQTSRALKPCLMKEDANAMATLGKNSLLAKHHILHNHPIDLEIVEIVDRSSAWRQRLILEARHSVRDSFP